MSEASQPSHVAPLPGKNVKIYPDRYSWIPDTTPPTAEIIQGGISTRPIVENELASAGGTGLMIPLLKHWTAIPALSFFLTNSMHIREAAQRVPPASSFKPPPRVTLTETKRISYLKDLANPDVQIRKLARTIPSGLSNKALLAALEEYCVPTLRALWLIKAVGANEIRTLRRKMGETFSISKVEKIYMQQWSEEVIRFVEDVICSFSRMDRSEWEQRIRHSTRIVIQMYHEGLLSRPIFTNWILAQVKTANRLTLLTALHYIRLLWSKFESYQLAGDLVRAIAECYNALGSCRVVELDALLLRLFKSIPDAFVRPNHWGTLEKQLKRIQLNSEDSKQMRCIHDRNAVFVTCGDMVFAKSPCWAAAHEVYKIFDTYTKSFSISEYGEKIRNINLNPQYVIHALIEWTLASGQEHSISLCVAILLYLEQTGLSVRDFVTSSVIELDVRFYGSVVYDFVTEIYTAQLLPLDVLFWQIIAKGLLYSSGKERNIRLILKNLPFCAMPTRFYAEVRMLLKDDLMELRSHNELQLEAEAIITDILKRDGDANSLGSYAKSLAKSEIIVLSECIVVAAENRMTSGTPPHILISIAHFLDKLSASLAALRVLRLGMSLVTSSDNLCFYMRELYPRIEIIICHKLLDEVLHQVADKMRDLELAYPEFSDDCVRTRLVLSAQHDPRLLYNCNELLCTLSVPTGPSPLSQEEDVATPLSARVRAAVDRREFTILRQICVQSAESEFDDAIAACIPSLIDDSIALGRLVLIVGISLPRLLKAAKNDTFTVTLLTSPSSNLVITSAELKMLEDARRHYFAAIGDTELLALLEIADRPNIQHVFHVYQDIMFGKLINLSTANGRQKLHAILTRVLGIDFSGGFSLFSLQQLLSVCTPFNISICQLAALNLMEGETLINAVNVILDAIKCACPPVELSCIISQLNLSAKMQIWTVAENYFLHEVSSLLRHPDVMASLLAVGVLAKDVAEYALACCPKADEDVDLVDVSLDGNAFVRPDDELLNKAAAVLLSEFNKVSATSLEQAATMLIRIAVVHTAPGLPHPHLPLGALKSFRCLRNISSGLSYSCLQTLLDDALRLLKITNDEATDEDQPDFVDNLCYYSKTSGAYRPFKIWSFDLLEDANPGYALNDLPVDLARFETYVERQ